MAPPTLAHWLREAPFGLTLSAGFFGFFAHTGFALALADQGLQPSAYSGSSAGAMVSAFLAAGRSPDDLAQLFTSVRREDFWDPAPGFGLLAGHRFRQLLERELPVADFEACPRPVAVSTFDVRALRTHVVQSGPLAPAVHASCVFPGLFHPVPLNGRPHIDGGVADRSGLAGMPAPRVLYHHLSTRSRVRRHIPALSGVPQRPGLQSVILNGLPAVGPYRLHEGPRAIEAARGAMRRALEQPVDGSPVIA